MEVRANNSAKKQEIKSDLGRKNETVSIRKISNGFIATKSWQEGSGNKTEYKSEEIYYKDNPL